MDNVNSLAQWTAQQFDPTLNWRDIQWVKSLWPGKLILKGILDVEDARIAAKTGAAALVVSNHGGRQLDNVAPTLRILPEVVASVGDYIEVLLDGGIRRGSDIVKAMCLGARAVMVGYVPVACATGESRIWLSTAEYSIRRVRFCHSAAAAVAIRSVGRSFIISCAVPAIRPISTPIFQARS